MLTKNLFTNHLKTKLFGTIGTTMLVALLANDASADQFIGRQNGREVVVHSNPIPVLLHRLVPPNYGRHVTNREYKASRNSNRPTASTAPRAYSTRVVRSKP